MFLGIGQQFLPAVESLGVGKDQHSGSFRVMDEFAVRVLSSNSNVSVAVATLSGHRRQYLVPDIEHQGEVVAEFLPVTTV